MYFHFDLSDLLFQKLGGVGNTVGNCWAKIQKNSPRVRDYFVACSHEVNPFRSPRGPYVGGKPAGLRPAFGFCVLQPSESKLSPAGKHKSQARCRGPASHQRGEKGIRTLGAHSAQRFSRPPRSTTPASLLKVKNKSDISRFTLRRQRDSNPRSLSA